MRACQPTDDGYVVVDGVKIYFEVFGVGEPTIVFLPTWEIVHSRTWKCQVPYFARHGHVVTSTGAAAGVRTVLATYETMTGAQQQATPSPSWIMLAPRAWCWCRGAAPVMISFSLSSTLTG